MCLWILQEVKVNFLGQQDLERFLNKAKREKVDFFQGRTMAQRRKY
jgi:hypothetical protein